MVYYTTQELVSIYIGCLIVGFLCVCGILLTINLTCNLCCVTTTNSHNGNRSTRPKINKLNIFHKLCLLLLVFGSVELIFQLVLFINKFCFDAQRDFLRYNDDTAFIENSMTMMVDFLHTCNVFLISIIFLIRLQKVFKGSIYDYPAKMYKFITIFCIFNIIVAFIGVIIDGSNEILQEINSHQQNRESRDWYIDFIPSFLPTILLAVAMLMYIIQQLILVVLMQNAFSKV